MQVIFKKLSTSEGTYIENNFEITILSGLNQTMHDRPQKNKKNSLFILVFIYFSDSNTYN